ncbi:hypothetical protein [Helicobacter salomonis]|uniref:hypothetical protein n=1 Tax=Helicobacter salomonis TaxID=56878 RepID=UPI000CF0E501|nr:hypothetical protein [Helicobacter salomonis]
MKFLIFLLLTLLLNATDNTDDGEIVSDGSYKILHAKNTEYIITQGDVSDSKVLKVNTDLKDSQGRSFWDKVFVYNPKDCQKLIKLNPNNPQEMEDYPGYFLYYKPTLLLATREGPNPESPGLARVLDVKLKDDVFTITPILLWEFLSALKGDLAKSQRLHIWYSDDDWYPPNPPFSGWMIRRLKFLDDHTATYALDAKGKHTDDVYRPFKYANSKTIPNLHICPYSAKTLLETIQKRHPEWKSDSSPHSQ